jgi:hypothetical protein
MFSFPTGVAVPAELDALFEFAEANGGEVSGLFEFDTDGSDSALAWFDKDPVPARDFAVFGRGPDGSQYALWLHAGSDTSTAPVVLLDSECRGSCVIADNVREFLRLLAIGYEEPGRYPTLEPEDRASAAKLRKWLKAQYKLVPPKTGAELVATAQARHPDLMAWITDWQNNR